MCRNGVATRHPAVVSKGNHITRAEALCILRPLVPDLQERVISLIFPTTEAVNVFKSVCQNPEEWDDLVFDLAGFASSYSTQRLLLDMEPVHFTYIRHCCAQLGLECKTADTGENYLEMPSEWGWKRRVVIVKPSGWTLNNARYGRQYVWPRLERMTFECHQCKGAMAFIPEGEFQYYNEGVCYGCLFPETRRIPRSG